MILPIPAPPPTQRKYPYAELEKIRFSQSCLLKCLLVQISSILLGTSFQHIPKDSPLQALWLLLLPALFVACCGTLYGFFSLLTKVVEPSKQGSYVLGFIVGFLLPLLNLFLIASVSAKANSILTGNGYKVNLLGAKKLSEEEVTNNQLTNTATSKPALIPGKSAYHTIANYGLWFTPASLLLFAIAVVLPEGFSLALGTLSGFIFLAVPITGLVALYGVFIYGKSKLLWKGLVLTIIPALIFIAALMSVHKKPIQNQSVTTISQSGKLQTPVMEINETILENLRKEPSLVKTLEYGNIHAIGDNVTIYFKSPDKSLPEINEDLIQQSYVPVLRKYLDLPNITETQASKMSCTILDVNGELVLSSKIWD